MTHIFRVRSLGRSPAGAGGVLPATNTAGPSPSSSLAAALLCGRRGAAGSLPRAHSPQPTSGLAAGRDQHRQVKPLTQILKGGPAAWSFTGPSTWHQVLHSKWEEG